MISNCSNRTTDFKAVNILSSSVGLVSLLACILVTVGIVYFKKYLFFTQRLVLYLSIAAVLNSISIMLRIESVFFASEKGWERDFCTASGFLEQVTGWWQLLAVFCITLSVFMRVVLNRRPEKIELLFPAVIFILPLTFNCIPFVYSSYGRAGAWCWIRNEKSDGSEFSFGQYLRFSLWYVPLYIILFILVVGYFSILCKIRSFNRTWRGRYDPETEEQGDMMEKEVRPLLWYPVFYLILNIFPLANRIQGAISCDPVLALWYLQALSDPLQGAFVSVAYALDSETIRRLDWRSICNSCRSRPQVREYPHEYYPGISDSLIRRTNQQSNTEEDT